MASYPGAIKNFLTLVDGVDNVVSAHPNDRAAEITAIETELGTDVAGSLSDLKTRLAVALNNDGTLNPSFGTRVSKADNTEYQATTDGYFLGVIIAGASVSAGRIIGYCDTTSAPSTVLGAASVHVNTDISTQTAYSNYNSFCIPIKSGNYYKGVKSSTGNAPTVTYWFIPSGGA